MSELLAQAVDICRQLIGEKLTPAKFNLIVESTECLAEEDPMLGL